MPLPRKSAWSVAWICTISQLGKTLVWRGKTLPRAFAETRLLSLRVKPPVPCHRRQDAIVAPHRYNRDMSKGNRGAQWRRAEFSRPHYRTTGGILRDYLTVHFWPDHVITHEVTEDGRDAFCVRDRTDGRAVHKLVVDALVLEVHEGRLHKLADLLALLQVAHHLRTVAAVPLRLTDRGELCEADSGRLIEVPPGLAGTAGRERVGRRA